MPLTFYPHEDDLDTSSIADKLDVLLEAADRFKAVVLDGGAAKLSSESEARKRSVPKDLTAAFNWEEIAKLLRNIREMSESTQANKLAKADALGKLAEIYEVLRAAKMAKLEAVRIALVNEANQLRTSAAQVA
jgi:acetyl-CoA acetyltransferase